MSSKINRYRQPARKSPTALTPKKSLGKSVMLENANKSPNDVPVIIIDSSSESSLSSSDSGDTLPRMQSPIVVPDSESSSAETPLKVVEKNRDKSLLSQEKYMNIKWWVDEVNAAKANEPMCSTVSTVLSDTNLKNSKPSDLASSSMQDVASERVDELFKKGKTNKNDGTKKSQKKQSKVSNQLGINDSLLSDNDTPQEENVIDDSGCKNPNENANQKIPNTERRDKKILTVTNKEENNNNLSKVLHTNRFRTTLKNVCDPDTDSDSVCNKAVNRGKENNNHHKRPRFLASLSGNVPKSKCDISALIFRTNFKQNRKALTNNLFQLYNYKVFGNTIPKETPLEWSLKMKRTAGYCRCRKIMGRTGVIERTVRIVLSAKVLNSANRLRDTLIHEMCHAAAWIINGISDRHGSYWKRWAYRARRVFPELPPIQRCHQYAINTKYTYKCVRCGYSFGRRTILLNTQKLCGCCFGTFEVLINKITKKRRGEGAMDNLRPEVGRPNLETTSRILTATNKSLNVPPAKKFKSSI